MKAFPNKEIVFNPLTEQDMVRHHRGMDLRDYFAAKAMLGMLSNQPISSKETTTINAYTLTKSAYQVADAMMKAREL